MKHLINIISIFAVLLSSSCGKKDPKEALEEFKIEMEGLEVVVQQVSAVDMEDGAAVIKAFTSSCVQAGTNRDPRVARGFEEGI